MHGVVPNLRFVASSSLLLLACACARAAGQQPDTPSRPVRAARLSFLLGPLQITRSDNTAEDLPVINMPLYEGTRIVAGDYAQAEIEFEDGSVVRLTPRTTLTLDQLGSDGAGAHTDLSLLDGLAYFELRKSAGSTYRVFAAGTAATPEENLVLRLSLTELPPTFSVLAGSAHIERSEAFSADLRTGETLRPDVNDDSRYLLSDQLTDESWDQWNASRDQVAADEANKRTIARNGYAGTQGFGWSDLDANGSWYNIPGQGLAWQPDNADETFEPYAYGAWTWSGAGYVWASGYTWGWTPFRCGRWNWYSSLGWAWFPDHACSRLGFAGGGDSGIFIGFAPPHHVPIVRPNIGPGKPHPTIPVHGPNGYRPPVVVGRPIRVIGSVVEPLTPVSRTSYVSGSPVGRALTRDFPIDPSTHEPFLGAIPKSKAGIELRLNPSANTGSSAPRYTRSAPGLNGSVPATLAPSRGQPSAQDASRTSHAPAPSAVSKPSIWPTPPMHTPPPSPTPMPVHVAPPSPPPARVHTASPPAPPAAPQPSRPNPKL